LAAPDAGLLSPGKTFHGHYEVVRCISTGAMGAVYEVVDQKTLRRRALKVMLPSIVSNAEMRERFKLEATITADIVSEHIVETFDADVDAETGAPFLVMELLRGDDLANILGERQRLAPPEVVLILSQAARALDKTHAAGIVHRDLKPENLFVTYRDDGTPRVKILDFGIAKVLAASGHGGSKQQTINLGTPPYMSPEQILGEGSIDHRADIYALGHIAYALLVGEPYWLEDSRQMESLYALLLRIVEGAKEPPTNRARRYGISIPPAFDAWFAQATATKPMYRYSRASDLVLGLAQALGVQLDTRPLTTTGSDWELESLMLSRTGVMRLAGGLTRPAEQAGPASSSHGPRIVVPPQPPLPIAPGMGPQSSRGAGHTPPAMTTPAVAQQKPQKKSTRKAALLVLLVAFVVGIGSAALIMRFTGSPGLPGRPVSASSGAPSLGPVASEAPLSDEKKAALDAQKAPLAEPSASVAGLPSADPALPIVTSTGKTPSSTPASASSATTKSTGTKAGTTNKKAGTYDPLRDL